MGRTPYKYREGVPRTLLFVGILLLVVLRRKSRPPHGCFFVHEDLPRHKIRDSASLGLPPTGSYRRGVIPRSTGSDLTSPRSTGKSPRLESVVNTIVEDIGTVGSVVLVDTLPTGPTIYATQFLLNSFPGTRDHTDTKPGSTVI